MKVKTLNGNLNIIGNCDIYEIEHGKKTVKDFEALAFCKVLGITLDDLYKDTDKFYEA